MRREKKDKNTNETLKSLTKLAKEQRELMSKLALEGVTKEIDKISKQLQTTLASPSIRDAFKSANLYSKTIKDLEKSFASQNVGSIQKLFESTIPSYLKKDYGLAFKATDQFKKTEERLKSLGIVKDYKKEWKKLSGIAGITTNPLDYATEVSKITAGLSQSSFSGHMKNISKGIDTVSSKKEPIVKSVKFNKIDINSITRDFNNSQFEIMRIQQEKVAKREKREQKVYENSEMQVELLKSIIDYMDNQSQNLSLQNEILSEQVENLKLQNNQAEEQINEIKKQNELMQEQQEENRKSSKTALWTAIISIFLGAVVGIGSIYFSYLLYQWQDKSDNQNHFELLQTIQKTSQNKEMKVLMKDQIKSSDRTNKLLIQLIKLKRQQVNKKINHLTK